MICPPLTLFMLCSPNEGAAAVVLCRDGDGVTVAGISLRSHLPGNVLGEDSPLCGIDDADITPPTSLAADDAYAQAGLGPDDVDVVECQDTDAARELLAWAELGLCAPGDQAAILEDGAPWWAAGCPSIPPAGCSPRANRWVPRRWARSSNWSASCAGRRGPAGGGSPGRARPRDRPGGQRLRDHSGPLTAVADRPPEGFFANSVDP